MGSAVPYLVFLFLFNFFAAIFRSTPLNMARAKSAGSVGMGRGVDFFTLSLMTPVA